MLSRVDFHTPPSLARSHAALPRNSVGLKTVLWRPPGGSAAPLEGECEQGHSEPPPLGVCSITASSSCPAVSIQPRIGTGLDEAIQRAIEWTLMGIPDEQLRMGVSPIGGWAPVS